MISLHRFSLQPGAAAEPRVPEAGERDWRGAYLHALAQERPPSQVDAQPQFLPPLTPRDPAPQPVSPPVRVGQRDQEPQLPAEPPPARAPLFPVPMREAPSLVAAPSTPSVTAQRVGALLTHDPIPSSRVWQVELPAVQPGWQLRVEQMQPQAPLRLDLSVPAVLQPQARRQLAELDKRLREAGHDVLDARLSDGPRVRPRRVDEVQP